MKSQDKEPLHPRHGKYTEFETVVSDTGGLDLIGGFVIDTSFPLSSTIADCLCHSIRV